MIRSIFSLLLLMFFVGLYGYDMPIIDSIEYCRDLYRANTYYDASLVIINDCMLISSKYSLEQHLIDESGCLQLIDYESYRYNHSIIPMIYYENTAYQAMINRDYEWGDYRSIIRSIEVTEDGWEDTNRLEIIDPSETLYNIQVNQDYLFYLMTGTIYATVIDRETFTTVTANLLTGSRFAVRDNLLFMQMIQYPDSTYVSIQDISDVMNPVEQSRVYSDDLEWNNYEFYNDLLIILKNTKVLLVDISDPANPELLSVVDDFSDLPDVNIFINGIVYDNYLIVMNNSSMLYVFDISNPLSPVLMNIYIDDGFLQRENRPLLVHNDNIYLVRQEQGISKIDTCFLPEIEITCDCLINKRIGRGQHVNPYYFFTVSGDLFYYNFYEESEVIQLSNDFTHSVYFTSNDSLLFFVVWEESESDSDKYLRIYSYDEENVHLVSDQLLSNVESLFRSLYWIEPYILIREAVPEIFKVFSLNDQYELIEEGCLSLPDCERSILLNDGKTGPMDYIYTFSYTTNNITVFANHPPFELLEQVNILQFGDYHVPYMFDDNYFVFYRYAWNNNYANAGLFYHLNLDQFIEIDHLYQIDRFFHCMTNINVFHLSEFFFTPREFYYFDQTGFHYLDNHDFEDINAYYIDFIPDENSMIVTDLDGYLIRCYQGDFTTSIAEEIVDIDINSSMLQNYPNPFNPETRIDFYLERAEYVRLEIYNIKGQRVAVLIDEELPQGEHSIVWQAQTTGRKDLSSGVYLYRLQAGEYTRTRKMLYLK